VSAYCTHRSAHVVAGRHSRDLHIVAVYAYGVYGQRDSRGKRLDGAGADVERRAVQRALHGFAEDFALGQRRFLVRAGVIKRQKLAIDVGEPDTLPPNFDAFHLARFQVVCPGD
jgi:hypothetical protein